ncbi:MAG: DoxX family protein [Chloroflexota bacterium]|nr:DoxX family protein [Chloroflexota bacterium]
MIRTGIRMLLSGIFIVGGWGAFSNPGARPKKVAAAGIPQPEQAVVLNGAVMIFAGILLSLGIAPRFAATLLIGSMIPTTIVGHPFWQEEPGPGRDNQLIQFLKNLGLIGGLLMVLVDKGEDTE